jgi:2-polyprenyl-6-hydroxyphenyl methylase/3-demethylubiquinone-9 3-methyltransferase
MADSWWDESSALYLLKTMVNPWRVPYFTQLIQETFSVDPATLHLLDIGSGGGFLTEEYARLGCRVTGIDLSPRSIAAARTHAQSENLTIEYKIGSAANLEFNNGQFDIVSCCDVLEHITNWQQVIKEISRVIKPGGLFLFDTINRTPQSWVTMIFGLQKFFLSRLFPANTHVWSMFIKPEEIKHALKKGGFRTLNLRGGVIPRNPLAILVEVRRYKTGKISAADLGQTLALEHGKDLSQNYLGAAVKKEL